MTFADRVAALLVLAAGAFGGWTLARHGLPGLAIAAPAGAIGIVAARIHFWTQSRLRSGLRFELRADGSLQVRRSGEGPVPATLGRRTRRVGPSVFLEVDFAFGSRRMRYARWLTTRDVPAGVLRRWSVVLPTRGRAACA